MFLNYVSLYYDQYFIHGDTFKKARDFPTSNEKQ